MFKFYENVFCGWYLQSAVLFLGQKSKVMQCDLQAARMLSYSNGCHGDLAFSFALCSLVCSELAQFVLMELRIRWDPGPPMGKGTCERG